MGGGGSTVILSQESRFGGGGGGGGVSNVILSARGSVGIASCSVGNCIVASCLVVASTLFSMHCPDMLMVRINNSITILVTYFFDVFFPLNISCCN